jgi:hypothetical protein
MKTIILTYPGFQALPKGVRQLLVATESFYYGETSVAAQKSNDNKPDLGAIHDFPTVANFNQASTQLAAA